MASEKVIWEPQIGGQDLFLSCPIYEALFEGTRGNGKTDALLMDFAQHVGEGYGAEWRGIIFRRTYPELDDIWEKAKKWFPSIFPGVQSNKSDYVWTFPDGEKLYFRHFNRPDDYDSYHGHSYPFIGWEELTSWPTDEGYLDMMTCCRSTAKGIPRKYRATTNPFGVGMLWVKNRFVDPAEAGTVIIDDEGQERVRVHGLIYENQILMETDPDYIKKLKQIRDPAKKAAWLFGSWDHPGGGIFEGAWDAARHVVRPFRIPSGWRLDRSFDWGSSKPFSVLWFAEANGEAVTTDDGRVIDVPRGTVFCIEEWYGSAGEPNKGIGLPSSAIAAGIIDREKQMLDSGFIETRPNPGPADSAIYNAIDGIDIGKTMETHGVRWIPSTKGPGSRVNGWEIIRNRLEAGLVDQMENPGLFIFSGCRELIKHLPALPRDKRKVDDVDTDAEDHDGDALRYRVSTVRHEVATAEAPW